MGRRPPGPAYNPQVHSTRSFLLALCLALVLLPPLSARAEFLEGTIVLDGQQRTVSWNDGDSFSFREGRRGRRRARLVDVNTLENFGPVHQWGSWSRIELYALSLQPGRLAASRTWKCTSGPSVDGYGRLLVRCPDLARELVKRGQAMVFAVDAPASPDLLAAQRLAQKRKLGMWRKGVPPRLITSAHSVLEGKGYNRVVDTRTGKAEAVDHAEAYETCEKVCVGQGKDASCLVFVPFKRRYEDVPACLTDPKIQPLPPRPSAARPKPQPPGSSL